jgi:AAA15 family ATPase/GTPase
MPLIVEEPNWKSVIDDAKKSVNQLILIVGPIGSGKSAMLKDAFSYNFTSINLGLELSRKLMNLSKERRVLDAEEIALSIIDNKNPARLALDNMEILFEHPIQLNPLTFLKKVSQQRLTIATWNGSSESHKLCYGKNGCPTYQEFVYSNQDTFIVVPTLSI